MTNAPTSRQSRRSFAAGSLKGLLAVAACAVGFGVMGVSAAQADTRCVAQAETIRGRLVPDTRAGEVRRHQRAACRVAIRKCERKLDRERRHTGRRMPFARCEVQRAVHVRDHHAPKFRCVAEASRRNGRALPATRSVEVRANRNRACNVAVAECNRALDRVRWQSGRRMPHARCDVIGATRVSDARLGRRSYDFFATFGR